MPYSGATDPQGLQFTPITSKAMRIFGELVHEWTTAPPKAGKEQPDGSIILDRAAFRQILLDRGLTDTANPGHDPDFEIRSDVTEIELRPRRPERFNVLLPEYGNLAKRTSLRVPAIYGLVDYATVGGVPDDNTPARTSKYFRDEAEMEAFLRPYMAAYICSQCA